MRSRMNSVTTGFAAGVVAGLLLAAPHATAQTCTDYDVATTTGQSVVPGTTDIGNHGDDAATGVALPFTFPFYGNDFNSVTVIANGNLQFSSTDTTFTNVCLPTATMIDLISSFWDDLRTDNLGWVGCASYPSGTCGIFTSVSGVAPFRIFNIEWRAVYFADTTAVANFEARLYETTGQIDFIYAALANGNSSATGGLQQGTGTAYESLFCNGEGQALSAGLRATFTCASGPVIPTTSTLGLAALALLLAGAALVALRRHG
jgi:hypothetical protein